MNLDLSNLQGVALAAVSDEKWVPNPFGIKDGQGRLFEALVGREGRPEWQDFVTSEDLSDPDARAKKKEIFKAQFRRQNRPGFRTKVASGGVDNQTLDDLAGVITDTTSDPFKLAQRLRRKKEGAARLLFLGGRYLDGVSGPVDLSLEENRLALLNYNRNPKTKQSVVCGTCYLLDREGKPQIDDETNEPIPNPWMGKPMGDALFYWIEMEAEIVEGYFAGDVAEVVEDFQPGLPGGSATGSPATEPSETL